MHQHTDNNVEAIRLLLKSYHIINIIIISDQYNIIIIIIVISNCLGNIWLMCYFDV